MAIERTAMPEKGGAFRVSRARVIPLVAPPPSYAAAVERYLTGAAITKSSARIYRISLITGEWMPREEPAPTGRSRPWRVSCTGAHPSGPVAQVLTALGGGAVTAPENTR
ncbi:hypothetical protein [Streptomyces sp. NPDC048196]|uniref:hypothetical protein n=1 Tax=Streptomyces sp. NPDC048196 TaxID=3154712 RepID=UPI003405EDCF